MDSIQFTCNASQSSCLAPSDDPIALLVKESEKQQFSTETSLKRSLDHRRQALYQGHTGDQYLVFTSIPAEQYSRLSDDRLRTRKYVRLLYNSETRILIAKVMPNPAHEFTVRSFDSLVSGALYAMGVENDVWNLGSTTVTIGAWKKEADCCWATAPTTASLSLVVEVSLSESASRLALDARSWLETQASSVELVITITIKRNAPEIDLQRWELVPRQYGARTRLSLLSARPTATLKLSRVNDATMITGESELNGIIAAITHLELSFDKVVGRAPHRRGERDLVISEQQLRNFAERIWRIQGIL